MGIQEIIAYVTPAVAGDGKRMVEGRTEVRDTGRAKETDSFTVSGQAKALFDAGRSQRYDTIRERVRQGYYLNRDVLTQMVDALARDVRAEGVV